MAEAMPAAVPAALSVRPQSLLAGFWLREAPVELLTSHAAPLIPAATWPMLT